MVGLESPFRLSQNNKYDADKAQTMGNPMQNTKTWECEELDRNEAVIPPGDFVPFP